MWVRGINVLVLLGVSWLNNFVAGSLLGSPEQGVKDWCCDHIFLSEKETPRPGFYDIAETPWAARLMDAVEDEGVREVVVRKSSRTGFTEGALNSFRWVPGHDPGHCLYAINCMPKAKEVMEKRLDPHLKEHWAHLMTDDPDDVTKSTFKLVNMDIQVSGSGGAGVFMEGWFKLIILDEYEEHSQEHEDTTADRARGRQVTVDNPTLFIISKPQLEGGPIDAEYQSGSQEKFHLACPHCGERQELIWEFVRFDHCKDLVGGYDMERVLNETYVECQHCHAEIYEESKRAMVNDGVWIPEPDAKREGEARAEEGKVSLHISDLYSLHNAVRWGRLAQIFLNAYVINPQLSAMKWFWTNHLGKAWEIRKAVIRDGDLDKLVAGFVKRLEDGTNQILGSPFKWCYTDRTYRCDLPMAPSVITVTVDKQGSELKGTVFAWDEDWQAWPIEYFRVGHEDDVLNLVEDRVYYYEAAEYKIGCGIIDSHYKPKEVYRACVRSKGKLFPSMGMAGNAGFRGKHIKTREDFIDGRVVIIYDYFNHAIESDFYLNKVKDMSEPRLWLPNDMGDEWGRELKSAKLIVKNKKEVWDKNSEVPNDWGDTCKMQYVVREILMSEGVNV